MSKIFNIVKWFEDNDIEYTMHKDIHLYKFNGHGVSIGFEDGEITWFLFTEEWFENRSES